MSLDARGGPSLASPIRQAVTESLNDLVDDGPDGPETPLARRLRPMRPLHRTTSPQIPATLTARDASARAYSAAMIFSR